ncbi:MAG: NYN domain-containing protein [candidate division WOR-3 bacterium]|nr:NYN domain-containing protein [candidate division WOR-3 bacterium]MDW8150504.1 NYN domain-containing protein [candidate division WOR-3 bacterium]
MLYLVDGYNVLYSTSFKNWIDKFGLQSARSHLINFIRSLERNVIIVFDGKENYPNSEFPNVVFTKGESADKYIKNFIKSYKDKDKLVVVSNDKSIISFARTHKVKTLSVEKFLNKSRNAKEEVNKVNLDEITAIVKKEWGLF